MTIKLLTYHLEFLSFNGGCTGSSKSTLVKMPHCWKSRVTAHLPNISGVHLILMIIWITIIKPDFGATACERHMFTFVSALIHTFCFLNLKDGQSRWRMLIYYVLVLIENSLMILLWFIYKLSDAPHWLVPLGFSVVFGGILFGVIFLMLYYGFCHASGPVPIPPPKPEFHKPPANVDQV